MAWQRLYEYWLGKHRDGKPPSRADIDPLFEIPKLLPNLFIIEIVGDAFRFRLIGSEIVRRAGRDSTGRLIDRSLLSERALGCWLRIIQKVAVGQVPVLYGFDPRARVAHSALGILTPLVGADGRTEMLIGGLFFGENRQAFQPRIPDRVYEIAIPDTHA